MIRTACIFVVVILLVVVPPSEAQEAVDEPILSIDVGMHTNALNGLAVDSSGRYAVTGSDDKSIRVWELPEGRLVRTIRPAIAEGQMGIVYGVALSPDGNIIAAGGRMEPENSATDSIYLFDRATGNQIRRISGDWQNVTGLAFSPDGRFLAAAFGGSRGLGVFQTTDGAVVADDRDYDDGGDYGVFGVAFAPDGRLTTGSYNGFVRLYDNQFRLVAKRRVQGGGNLFRIAFSPDGARIAVGMAGATRIDVFSGEDLSYLFSPDTSGIDAGLISVAWSDDAQWLYGAGLWNVDGKNPIRRWSAGGRGDFEDVAAASYNIVSLRPVPGGGIAFASNDSTFGIIDAAGRQTFVKEPPIVDFRGAPDKLLLSADGREVAFGNSGSDQSTIRFSLTDNGPVSEPDAVMHDRLVAPRATVGRLRITDWEDSSEPRLNGRKLKLAEWDIARCVAVASDGKSFLLGSSYGLNYYDRKGNFLWYAPGAEVWQVNISADNRVAVAARADGTIRWYRLSDGQELLALFPHPVSKRWVLWTPSGYYDASAGGEDLIGWQVNRGLDQAADFFPGSRFRSISYRSDIVARVLATLDEDQAVRLADEERGRQTVVIAKLEVLPPVVSILSPGDSVVTSEAQITIEFDVRSDDPVTAVKTLVDGRPTRGITVVASEPASEKRRITVAVPQRDSEIAIVAENRNGASVPAIVRVRWQGETPEFVIKPKLYVLAIGVSEYQTETLKLGFPAKDARDFAAALSAQKEGIYRDVVVRAVTDEEATKGNILDALEWIETEVTSKDVAMVLIAGHGVNDSNGQYYYLPTDVDTNRLKRTAIAFYEIKNTVSNLAGKVLFFVDTCHAGNVMGTRRGVVDVTSVVNELATAENGVVVFAASTGKQYSLEDAAWGNGAFTKAVVEGLGGLADYQDDGSISINELDLYLSERVKELTGGRQTPTTTKPATVPDFPIAISQ